MAVTKIWAIHDSVSRVVEYCSNPEKTKLTDLEQVSSRCNKARRWMRRLELRFPVKLYARYGDQS